MFFLKSFFAALLEDKTQDCGLSIKGEAGEGKKSLKPSQTYLNIELNQYSSVVGQVF